MIALEHPIASSESPDLFEALSAVQTIHNFVGQWTETHDSNGFAWQDSSAVRGAYDRCLPMTQNRFAALADQLCTIAQTGALHLLESKDRRGEVADAAVERLQREIEKRTCALYRMVKIAF